jgi:hypothetical protein
VAPSILVAGPFAACGSTNSSPATLGCKGRGGCDAQCYLHSYNGFPTATTSIFGGIKAAAGSSAAVTYSLGSNMTCNNQEKGSTGQVDCVSDPSSKFHSAEAALAIQELVAAAKTAEVVVLAVGLGASLE